MTVTEARPEVIHNVFEETDTEDPIHTHIIPPTRTASAKAIVTEAMIMGTPVTALCGYTWVPRRDPQKFPLCTKCEEIARKMGILK